MLNHRREEEDAASGCCDKRRGVELSPTPPACSAESKPRPGLERRSQQEICERGRRCALDTDSLTGGGELVAELEILEVVRTGVRIERTYSRSTDGADESPGEAPKTHG